MTDPEIKALAFRVTGRVQGVWFRAWTRREAEALGLSGWVRNEADGTVSGVIEGFENPIRRMADLLHEGPELARVDDVWTEPRPVAGYEGFDIRR